MQNLKKIHRVTMLIIVGFTLFLGVTGTVIQVLDLRSILGDVSANDGNIRAMREGFTGPPNYQVLRPSDYTATPLAAIADPDAALTRVLATARKQLNGKPINFVELRTTDGRPMAYIASKKSILATEKMDLLTIDVTSGEYLGTNDEPPPEKAPKDAFRNKMKTWHKFLMFGKWALAINFIVLVALVTLIVTGLLMYWKVYAVRRDKLKRPSPFWSGGGFWREFHRHASILATVFILIVVASGSLISFETLVRAVSEINHPTKLPSGQTEFVDWREGDKSSPLTDAELPKMLQTVTSAYQSAMPNASMRAVRLRYFAGLPQGVVITNESTADQLVFNANSGQAMTMTEPGYPQTGFPFGWRIHQLAKNIHRGDVIGLPGRAMSLFAGLSLIFLSVSGIYMYWTMWKARQKKGLKGLIWK